MLLTGEGNTDLGRFACHNSFLDRAAPVAPVRPRTSLTWLPGPGTIKGFHSTCMQHCSLSREVIVATQFVSACLTVPLGSGLVFGVQVYPVVMEVPVSSKREVACTEVNDVFRLLSVLLLCCSKLLMQHVELH